MSGGPFQAEVRRELRDRRAGILVLAGSVAAMVALAWPLTGGHPQYDLREAMPGAAAFLAFLVVGLDLFSRGVRGGPWTLVLRTPGAFRTAFAARLLVLLVAALVAVAVEEATRRILEGVTHTGSGGGQGIGPFGSPREGAWLSLAIAAGAWIVVGSVWSAAGGAASLIGLLGFLIVVAPFAILHAAYPYAFFTYRSDAWVAGLSFAALGLAVLAIGYAWGRRRLTGSGPATLAGICLAVVASCGGAAMAWSGVTRWLDFNLTQPEARLSAGPFAVLGEGGRFLYVTAHRGRPYEMSGKWSDEYHGDDEAPDGPGTPPRPFVIDLVEGSSRPLGAFDEYVWLGQGVGAMRAIVPVRWVTVTDGRKADARSRWIDARTATERLVVAGLRQPPETTPWAREVARALSPHRDSKGRRVWTLDGRVEREGEPQPDGIRPSDIPWAYAAPGGWTIIERGRRRYLDLESGALTSAEDARPDGRTPAESLPLGPTRFLARGAASLKEKRPGDEAWTLVDRESMTERPTGLGEADDAVTALFDGRVLVLGGGNDPTLSIWNPSTEARSPVRTDGPPPPVLREFTVSGASLPDGRVLLLWSAKADILRQRPVRWSLFDPTTATERVVASTPAMRAGAVAVLPDSAILVIEDERRVVRYGPKLDERVVLWPKPTGVR